MNPKYNYSPALQEDARRFEERLNRVGDISSFGTTVRIKDMLDGHTGVEDSFGGNRMGGYTCGLRPTLSL